MTPWRTSSANKSGVVDVLVLVVIVVAGLPEILFAEGQVRFSKTVTRLIFKLSLSVCLGVGRPSRRVLCKLGCGLFSVDARAHPVRQRYDWARVITDTSREQIQREVVLPNVEVRSQPSQIASFGGMAREERCRPES